MCSQCLREEKVIGDVTIHSASFNVIPLDEDVVSMEINNAFSYLSFPLMRVVVSI